MIPHRPFVVESVRVRRTKAPGSRDLYVAVDLGSLPFSLFQFQVADGPLNRAQDSLNGIQRPLSYDQGLQNAPEVLAFTPTASKSPRSYGDPTQIKSRAQRSPDIRQDNAQRTRDGNGEYQPRIRPFRLSNEWPLTAITNYNRNASPRDDGTARFPRDLNSQAVPFRPMSTVPDEIDGPYNSTQPMTGLSVPGKSLRGSRSASDLSNYKGENMALNQNSGERQATTGFGAPTHDQVQPLYNPNGVNGLYGTAELGDGKLPSGDVKVSCGTVEAGLNLNGGADRVEVSGSIGSNNSREPSERAEPTMLADDQLSSSSTEYAAESTSRAKRSKLSSASAAAFEKLHVVNTIKGVLQSNYKRSAGPKPTSSDFDDNASTCKDVQQCDTSACEKPRCVGELTASEKDRLLANCSLGCGFVVASSSISKTSCSAISQIDISSVCFADGESREQEVIVSSLARATAFSKIPWTEACFAVKNPWIADEADDCANNGAVAVIGRFLQPRCQVSFSGKPYPHPDFKFAVDRALAQQDCTDRSEELRKIFSQYGHYYATCVELGGMKQMQCTAQMSEQKSKEYIVKDMETSLDKKFGGTTVSVSGGDCASKRDAPISGGESVTTVGGNVQECDVTRWKSSLSSPANWCLTRITRVESTITLFDEATQARIMACAPQSYNSQSSKVYETPKAVDTCEAAQIAKVNDLRPPALPKVPLYRLFSSHAADHFYTTNAAERDNAVRAYGYKYECPAAQILATPSECAIPLFRIFRNREHFYTTDVEEKNRTVPYGRDEGIAGFVYGTRQSGTIPLYRLYQPNTDDHFYTTSAPEKESCMTAGGWNDEGIACYVYP